MFDAGGGGWTTVWLDAREMNRRGEIRKGGKIKKKILAGGT